MSHLNKSGKKKKKRLQQNTVLHCKYQHVFGIPLPEFIYVLYFTFLAFEENCCKHHDSLGCFPQQLYFQLINDIQVPYVLELLLLQAIETQRQFV